VGRVWEMLILGKREISGMGRGGCTICGGRGETAQYARGSAPFLAGSVS
jgi:hypothetical protein